MNPSRRVLTLASCAALCLALGPLRGEELFWDGKNNLEDFLQIVKSKTGKRFVYDPNLLKDKHVTILAPDFHEENYLQVFEAILEMNNLGLAASGDGQGEIFKIIPAANLKTQPLPIFSAEDLAKLPPGDRLVTQIFTLKHVDALQVGQTLQLLVHQGTGDIRAIPNTNVVAITDYASNMRRLARIIEIMDQQNAPPRVEIFPLKFATSAELAPKLNQLLTNLNAGRRAGAGGPPQPGQASLLVTDDQRTNSVIVIGYDADFATLKGLIEKLDLDLGADQNTIRFFPLQHRNARDLATVIQAMYTEVQNAQRAAQAPGTAAPRPGPVAAGSPDSGLQVLPRIVADEVTNAIIAIGPPRSFKELKETIERLDTRRPQVFIEATIMEVGEDSTRQLGTQLASVESPENRSVLFAGTNFGLTQPAAGGDPTVQNIAPAQGIVAGIFKDSTNKIPLILRALQTNNDTDVIATPSLMTNDNQRASVVISDQQPTITTSQGTATTNSTFAGFQNADTRLEITPHISTEGAGGNPGKSYLRLEVVQTLEKFVGASTNAGVPPPKESRTTTTTVTVPDGSTVIISGFTRKDRRSTVSKVPVLGDIPLLGFLFRNKTTVDVRTNLFVFITPHVITDLGQLENLGKTLKTRREWDQLEKTLREGYFDTREAESASESAPPPKTTPRTDKPPAP